MFKRRKPKRYSQDRITNKWWSWHNNVGIRSKILGNTQKNLVYLKRPKSIDWISKHLWSRVSSGARCKNTKDSIIRKIKLGWLQYKT